jgi:hypothetical protein
MGYTQVVNEEGGAGMQWLAESPARQDPRVPVTMDTVNGTVQFTTPVQQSKYHIAATNTLILADGIEARLIEAEAQLSPAATPSGPWLATLNTLRASVGLPDTTDPGTAPGRIGLLFHERAFWLYLTGHREGDLRRLVRQYNYSVDAVYPWGLYPWPSAARVSYGDLVVIPVPAQEKEKNVLYNGCVSLDP